MNVIPKTSLVAATAILLAGMLAGCGTQAPNTTGAETKDASGARGTRLCVENASQQTIHVERGVIKDPSSSGGDADADVLPGDNLCIRGYNTFYTFNSDGSNHGTADSVIRISTPGKQTAEFIANNPGIMGAPWVQWHSLTNGNNWDERTDDYKSFNSEKTEIPISFSGGNYVVRRSIDAPDWKQFLITVKN